MCMFAQQLVSAVPVEDSRGRQIFSTRVRSSCVLPGVGAAELMSSARVASILNLWAMCLAPDIAVSLIACSYLCIALTLLTEGM